MDHRAAVGGLWEEIGELQFDFMVSQGLKPHHRLLDIGCGCLRGGVHFIKYLDQGNYHGIDKNTDLLKAGLKETKMAGLGHKLFHLMPNGDFEFERLETTFDFAIAQSLFTHLNLNEILLCLINAKRVLKDGGALYATIFNCPDEALYNSTIQWPTDDGKIIYTKPAFSRSVHYHFSQMWWAATYAGLNIDYLGEWGHPRKQEMVVFRK